MTARDYFFKIVAPEHAGRSYHAVHRYNPAQMAKQSHSGIPAKVYEQIMAKAIDHIPFRSNDILTEQWMKELIALAPVELKPRLENMFIAKLRDYEANAAALCDADYEGDLIFFNVGLSDLCFQYAIIYYEFIRLFGEHFSPDDAPRIEGLKAILTDHVAKVASAQDRWDRLGAVRFAPDDVINSSGEIEQRAAKIAGFTDKFILCHEISHHILGHTEPGTRPLVYVDSLPDHCKYWRKATLQSHQQEYEADASALIMTLQAHCADVETERQRELQVVIGGLLTLTVLGQLVSDVDEVTPSHPSVSSRFDQCLDVLRSACKYETRAIFYIVKQFQALLWHTQRKGLGRRWSAAEIRL